jgi:hypothetical protein
VIKYKNKWKRIVRKYEGVGETRRWLLISRNCNRISIIKCECIIDEFCVTGTGI